MDRAEISIDKKEFVRIFAFQGRQEIGISVGQGEDGVVHISATTSDGEILVLHISDGIIDILKPQQ